MEGEIKTSLIILLKKYKKKKNFQINIKITVDYKEKYKQK